MIGDYFKLALGSIFHRKLRSWLTMIGIFIGVMAVVALISLGDGLQATINEEFEKVGTNRITILPGGGSGESALFAAGGFSGTKLTQKDVDVVNQVRGIDHAMGLMRTSAKVEYAGETKYLLLVCVPTEPEDLKFLDRVPFFEIESGSMLERGGRYNVVVGRDLSIELFHKKVGLNNKIVIEGQEFTTIGIFAKASEPMQNQKVVLTREMCNDMLNITDDEVSQIVAEVKEGYNTTQVAENVKEKLRKERGLEKDKEDFTVATPEDIMRIFLSIVGMVQLVLTGIAGISLLVGGIGIMNTMYTAVLERTREIGILKAVGARNSDVLILFLVEAGLLGTVGGAIGTSLGLGIAKMVEWIAINSGLDLLRVSISPALLAGSIGFSFIVGSISGITPAMRAANMKPVEALRK